MLLYIREFKYIFIVENVVKIGYIFTIFTLRNQFPFLIFVVKHKSERKNSALASKVEIDIISNTDG